MELRALAGFVRIVRNNPLFTVITMSSLVVGLSAALLAGAYINRELSFDDWLPDADHLLRLEAAVTGPQQEELYTGTQSGLRPALEAVFGSDIAASARIFYQYDTVRVEDAAGETLEQFSHRIAYSDAEIFDVLQLRFIEGDPRAALARPDGMVLTQNVSTALFGPGAAVGKVVQVRDQPLVVTGVVENIPYQSHLSMEVFAAIDAPSISPNAQPELFDGSWGAPNVDYYLRAASPAAMQRLQQELVPRALEAARSNMEAEDFRFVAYEATPVTAIHMRPARNGVVESHGSPMQLFYLSGIALVLLGMAGFNYVLLSLARVFQRAREVGIRKAIGGSRAQLFRQYMSEAAVLTLSATALAFVVAELSLPFFSAFTQSGLLSGDLRQPGFLAWILGGALLLTLLIGAYPALYLSSLRPGLVLKGQAAGTMLSVRFFHYMVGVMFAAAVLLAVLVTVMYVQFRYITTQDLGYKPDNLLSIEGVGRAPAETVRRVDVLRGALRNAPGIEASAASSALPYWDYAVGGELVLPDADTGPEAIPLSVGFDYLQTYGIPLLAGRDFGPAYGLDRTYYDDPVAPRPPEMPIIVSMEMVRALGFGSAAAALDFPVRYRFANGVQAAYRIVGVVPDIHFRSLYNPILPMFFIPNPAAASALAIRILPGEQQQALASIAQAWQTAYPERALDLSFVANELGRQYQRDGILLRVLGLIAGCALALTALGLYGLVAFDTEKRRKEIGIRKVLGALPAQIVQMLVTQLSRPLVLAAVLSWPVAWYVSQNWLNSFSYRIPLTPGYFIGASVSALAFMLLAMLFRASMAAATPPVEALRSE